MSVLWLVLVLGVCDVALCMEGPRGKVTREMCSKPASQVPEETWPYCCEGYGMLCEDFAASCYLDCQPVVSSGHDVTLVEERPGFCCALYNFCCAREFSRIDNLQTVQIEEVFPVFHRFHGPGKIAPRGPPPRKTKAKQVIKNDISEISNTVNRIGHTRKSSRNNEIRVQQDRFDPNSAKSLEVEVIRSAPQHKRSNQKVNVVKPQRSPARFPHRPQNDKNKENDRPTSPRLQATNFGQLKANNESSIQSDDSFRKITPIKKTETQSKNTNNVEDKKNINENNQQLNEEAENRKITLNRAGVTHIEKESKVGPSSEAAKDDENQEKLTPTKQIKRVSIPRIIKRQPEIKTEHNSKDKQVIEEENTSVTTEEPITARPSNGRKVKLGKRVLVRTASKKTSNNEQENQKPTDSPQNNQKVTPIASRRTLISNRQTGSRTASKKNNDNEQEDLKSNDSIQNNQEVKPIASRRTIISNRQTTLKKISNNEQEVLKSINSEQNNQEIKPTASRRTLISNRQTNSRNAPKKVSNNEKEVLKTADSVQINQEVKPTASRRTLISNRQTGSRIAPKKISNNEQEILKSADSVQNNKEVKTLASRRTFSSSRQSAPKKISNNEQEMIKFADSVQNNQEVKPIASRRTLISNRQTAPKKISNNEQEVLKSTDFVENKQKIKPIASRRTVISNRQTGSRRPKPIAPNTKESTRLEKNQEESTASRGTDRNNGRRIKQTVRRISSDKTTQNESVKLPSSTIKIPHKVVPVRRISTSNKPDVDKSVVLASDLEKKNVKLDAPQISKFNLTSAVLRQPFNTTQSITLTPLRKETKAPTLDLDTSETQTSEAQEIHQNNVKISVEEKEKPKDKTESESLQQAINANIQKIVRDLTEQNLKQLEMKNGNKINENQQENKNSSSKINSSNNRQGRTRIRVTAPTAVESRDAAAVVTGRNSATTNTRTRSRISRTRNQESTQQKETSTSTITNRGTSRSGRAELFGRKDVSKTPVQNVPENNENTARRTFRSRGRQPT